MISIESIHWHTLAPQFLNANSTVLDLGAHFGQFAHAITERVGCQCVAVEPSTEILRNFRPSPRIKIINGAVGGKSGTRGFRFNQANPVGSALDDSSSVQVRVMTLPELMEELGWSSIDLLKADIEGSEIEMLDSCSDQFLSERVRQLSVEFHDFCGIVPLSVVKKTISRLEAIGFASIKMSRVGHQDTWFVNCKLLPIKPAEMLFHKFITRNVIGAKRIVARTFGRKAP